MHISTRLLAAIALFAAPAVSVRAQTTDWNGQLSSDWFFGRNWNSGIPRRTIDVNIDTVTPNATVVGDPGAEANNLTVGASGSGTLAIQAGGTLLNERGVVGNLAGGLGTVLVTGAGSSWTNINDIVIGGLGTGVLTIQDGGTVTSAGGSIGMAAGSTGAVTVDGPGATWINGPQRGLNIGSFGMGSLTVSNGARLVNIANDTANIGNRAGSQGTVLVIGADSIWSNSSGLNIGNSGTGTLTIADGGVVTGPITIATNVGATGTLNIGAGVGNPAAAPGTITTPSLVFGAGAGTLNFNHTSVNYVFSPAISGNGTVNVLAGSTVFTGANSYNGTTNIAGGVLRAGALNTLSPNSAVRVASGGALGLNGFSHTVPSLLNAGVVATGPGAAPGTLLTTVNYAGSGGTIVLNTFLGSDGSPSDRLIIDSGGATGSSFLRILNAGGSGAQTVASGIAVVQAINGGTTAPGAFALAGEAGVGAFSYFLFRGGLDGGNPEDWFLRSSFVVPPLPGTGPPVVLPAPIDPSEPTLPTDPPPDPLPPGVYPIIGPRIATYGVVQPIARQMGMTTLGSLHERTGDVSPAANAGWGPSAWGRIVGQDIDNRYEAFADPRASGELLGLQSGFDLWRGASMPGHRDAAGVYVAYVKAEVDAKGLVTNETATAYVLRRTGDLDLDAWSGGAYWTHIGPGGWYLDAVAQATHYESEATTRFTELSTPGFGVVTSLEAGYPIPLPIFGPGFALEPQAQVVWQHVSFDDANDGLGEIELGSTSGVSGRIGLRGPWTIVSDSGQVWQPYVRANLWRDEGARATVTYSGLHEAPLLEEGNRLQLGGGLNVRMNVNASLYVNADYQLSVGDTDGGRREGLRGGAGVRYTW